MELSELIDASSQLLTPPDVWVKINELVHSQHACAQDMAEVIEHDPGLTANILRVVNSAFYNLPRQVDTVSRAITIIGTDDLYNLATALTATRVFANIPCRLTSPEIFWGHSVACAILSKKLATECAIIGKERLYVAGLLHDIGSLLIYSRMPDNATEVLMMAAGDEEVLYQVENEIFGFNHAMVSAALLKLWNLPENLVSAVEFHHDPLNAGQAQIDAALVNIANHTVNRHPGSAFVEDPGTELTPLNPCVWELCGLDRNILETLLAELEHEMAVALSIMAPPSSRSENVP